MSIQHREQFEATNGHVMVGERHVAAPGFVRQTAASRPGCLASAAAAVVAAAAATARAGILAAIDESPAVVRRHLDPASPSVAAAADATAADDAVAQGAQMLFAAGPARPADL